jgi:DNA-binding Lrp family transcriptional regulator
MRMVIAGGFAGSNPDNWHVARNYLTNRQRNCAKWQAMDRIDRDLVTLLRHDARRTISDLATAIGVSRATVRARMERLERDGEILGYTVILRADAVGAPVRGLMLIAIEGQAAGRVIRSLGGFPEISAIHTTNGRWDLIVELGAVSLPDLDAVLGRIRLIPGVTASETNLLLATPRSTRARLRAPNPS